MTVICLVELIDCIEFLSEFWEVSEQVDLMSINWHPMSIDWCSVNLENFLKLNHDSCSDNFDHNFGSMSSNEVSFEVLET